MDRVDRHPTRRRLLSLGLGAFVVSLVPFDTARRRRLVRRRLPIMGTFADVAVVHDDPRQAAAAIEAAFAALRDVDRGMTRFAVTSDVGRANARAAVEPVEVSAETARVLEQALAWARASDGAFDPCLGRATRLWDPVRRSEPPAAVHLEALAGRRLYDGLVIEPGRRVRFLDPAMALDLGGIAKGFGVDRAAEALRLHGVTRGLVNVGGDLVALGDSEDGDPWRVGVRSPHDPDGIARTLEVVDAAVATSGDYERVFRHDGNSYHHLLDPSTAAPRRTDVHSVTVVAHDCMTADAAATAAFGMDRGRAELLLTGQRGGARLA
jgi:thiamine biosynthesis lipoprotein